VRPAAGLPADAFAGEVLPEVEDEVPVAIEEGDRRRRLVEPDDGLERLLTPPGDEEVAGPRAGEIVGAQALVRIRVVKRHLADQLTIGRVDLGLPVKVERH
jgi:hypothetical protein